MMETNLISDVMGPVIVALFAGVLVYKRIRETGNPLNWCMVDRCILFIAILMFMGVAAALGEAVFYLGRIPYFNWKFFHYYKEISQGMGMGWVCLLLIGLWLRRNNPESRLFAYFVVQFNAVHLALLCYIYGPLTHSGIFTIVMAMGFFNILLFELEVALSWIVTITLLLVISVVLTGFDLIPYAPIFASAPFFDGKIEAYFLGTGLIISIVTFLIMLFLIFYIITRWRDREKRLEEMTTLLKKMFGRYLSTEVMNTIIEDPLSLELGGERREVTIMMTDLRGFTALSERLEPEQVVQMLNSYFEIMVEVILRFNGTINEIIGDALLVIFGAPQEMSDKAQNAIACAISMQNAMATVNRENRELGLPELEMGIGLNEAEVIVGNIGSSKRSKYTVVGSGVNMASRIESYTVGGQVLISESLHQVAGEILRIDSQREVLPKGADATIKIFEVGGIAGNYNLYLEEEDQTLVTLERQIFLRYMLVEGKHVGNKGIKGSIVSLSKKSAEIALNESIDLLSNLKMNLDGVDEDLSIKNFYGKVIAKSGDDGYTHLIRFTSIPPEISAYFQAHRQYNV